MRKFFRDFIALGFIVLMVLALPPLKKQNWRRLGLYEAFIIALFTEMYGFLMSKGWSRIHTASGDLVTDGVYRYVRHPQYLGLIVITVGLLIQWPTIITLAMWPVLILMYYRLAKREEKEEIEAFGERYEEYKGRTPMFLPSINMQSKIA